MVNVGEKAPDFTLKNTNKDDISLGDYSGKTVVLAFYPGAFTGVCDKEMCSIQDNLSQLNDSNAVVLGISVDSPWANSEFSKKYDLDEIIIVIAKSSNNKTNLELILFSQGKVIEKDLLLNNIEYEVFVPFSGK